MRHEPAERCVGVVHGVDRAVGGRRWWRSPRGPSWRCRSGPPCPPCCRPAGARSRCGPRPASRRPRLAARPRSTTARSTDEDHGHGREHRPSLAGVADHHAEGVAEGGGDQQDRQHLEEVRQRRRVLEGVRGVDVEEAAPVGAELLDGDLRGGRAHRDDLLGERRLLGRGLPLLVEDGLAVLVGHRLVVLVGWTTVTLGYAANVWTTPWDTRARRENRWTAAAGCRASCGSDRPRSCRWSRPSGARSRGSARPGWPCRRRRRRSSATVSASIWVR